MADNKSGASESALGWGILAAVFAALGYLIWWYFDAEIKSGIRWIRYAEMWVASLFVGDLYMVSWQGQPITLKEMMQVAASLPADRIDAQFLGLISTVALAPYVPVFILCIICFGAWALRRGPGTEHRNKYNLDTLLKRQANVFPIISPFINFNPAKQPPRPPGADVPAELPLFAEALGPEEWIAYNEIPIVDKKLDEQATVKAFAKQLGPRWRGAKNLAPYKQVMLAAFCLKAARKRADADTMLGKLALCWSDKGGLKINKALLREAQSVLRNGDLSGATLKKCNQHAWETTALVRALNTAREEGGVLAPAQFVWLRAHDRSLWYSLNNLGRQSFHMEAIGAVTHYKAEKLAQRPIPRPKVMDAVKTLSEYMESRDARPVPRLDYSHSKKSGIKKAKTA
jgi:intracellular multiplication protein IcmP